MNLPDPTIHIVNGEDGKYGYVVEIPKDWSIKKIHNKKPGRNCDPVHALETVGIEFIPPSK